MHSAVTYRNIRKLKRLLEDHIFDINECNEEGKPLLVIAADKDDDEMVSLLLEQQDVNPLIADKDGYTVLHVLALKGKLAFMKTIFQKFPEIDVNMQNNNKETPLMCAAKTDSAGVIHYLFERGNKWNDLFLNRNFTVILNMSIDRVSSKSIFDIKFYSVSQNG